MKLRARLVIQSERTSPSAEDASGRASLLAGTSAASLPLSDPLAQRPPCVRDTLRQQSYRAPWGSAHFRRRPDTSVCSRARARSADVVAFLICLHPLLYSALPGLKQLLRGPVELLFNPGPHTVGLTGRELRGVGPNSASHLRRKKREKAKDAKMQPNAKGAKAQRQNTTSLPAVDIGRKSRGRERRNDQTLNTADAPPDC